MPPIISPLDPDDAPEADLADVHALALAAHPIDMPEDPAPGYDLVIGNLRQTHFPQEARFCWAARVDGHVVGYAKLLLLSGPNSGLGQIRVLVHPGYRRQGLGTELMRHAAAQTGQSGRARALAWPVKPASAGESWVKRLGFVTTLHTVIQRLEVRGDTTGMVWDAPVAPGYRLVQWRDTAPEDLLAEYARSRQAIGDGPSGSSSYTDDQKWTPESIRDEERKYLGEGLDARVAVAVCEADGTVAGLTRIVRYPHNPRLGLQMETAVVAAHRGRGLGLALKGAALHTVLDAWPEMERIHTSNNATNEHMLAVNRALGFRPLRELIHSEAETAQLIDTLAQLQLR